MTLAPRADSTAADVLRLLAAWLVAIVLLQGIAAAQALGLGPLHRHGEAAAAQHHHADDQRHHHKAVNDVAMVVSADDADIDAAAFALTAALALMALGHARWRADVRRHVWRAARAWAWRTTTPALLRRPPKPR